MYNTYNSVGHVLVCGSFMYGQCHRNRWLNRMSVLSAILCLYIAARITLFHSHSGKTCTYIIRVDVVSFQIYLTIMIRTYNKLTKKFDVIYPTPIL